MNNRNKKKKGKPTKNELKRRLVAIMEMWGNLNKRMLYSVVIPPGVNSKDVWKLADMAFPDVKREDYKSGEVYKEEGLRVLDLRFGFLCGYIYHGEEGDKQEDVESVSELEKYCKACDQREFCLFRSNDKPIETCLYNRCIETGYRQAVKDIEHREKLAILKMRQFPILVNITMGYVLDYIIRDKSLKRADNGSKEE